MGEQVKGGRFATPGQTIGPFFHEALAFKHCHELVPETLPGAVRLHGMVLDGDGCPVPDGLLEIRQANPDGLVPRVQGSLRRDGTTFTGWGRSATDSSGRFTFTTLEPGSTCDGAAPFFAITVFARGLLNRLFTRAYVPSPHTATDPFLNAVAPERRATLVAQREDDGSLRFDVHLQGQLETVFLSFPGHQL